MTTKQRITIWFDLAGSDLKPRAIDGRELDNWQDGPTMQSYMHQLFQDGWQIVRQTNPGTIIFERDQDQP